MISNTFTGVFDPSTRWLSATTCFRQELEEVWCDPSMAVARLPGRLLSRIVRAYDEPIARAYCHVRFLIIRERFLEQIGRHLPASGTVLDIGCGFGLFALYFASTLPGVEIRGFDVSPRRVAAARRAARTLGLRNVQFEVADAAGMTRQDSSAVYMVDLIHHVPPASVPGLLHTIASSLEADGRLVIKDIEPAPRYKLAFTWLLDKLVDYRAPVHYWTPADVQQMLQSLGFQVNHQRMSDFLPYPHILYVGIRQHPDS